METTLSDAIGRLIAGESGNFNTYRSQINTAVARDNKVTLLWQGTNGVLVKRIKITISDLSKQIKTAPDGDKAKFGGQIKALKGKIAELKIPPKKFFMNLPLDVRKFAAADYILQQTAIQDKTIVDFNPDVIQVGKISGEAVVPDFNRFRDDSELGQSFKEINDYIARRVEENQDSLTRPADIVGMIKSDQQKFMIRGETADVGNMIAVSRYWFKEKGVRSQSRQKMADRIQNSQTDIMRIMEMENYGFYRLLPNDSDENVAFKFEGDEMHNCIGWNGYADRVKKRQCEIYSMREREKNGMLKPRVSIEVNGKTAAQIKGPCNSAPPFKYAKYLHAFLIRKMKFIVPESLRRSVGQLNGKYNVFDFPKEGANIDRLELTPGDAPGIDTNRIKKITRLYLTGNMTEADILAVSHIGCIQYLYINCREQSADVISAAKINVSAIYAQYADQKYYEALASLYSDKSIRVINSCHRIVNPDWGIEDFLKYLGCRHHQNDDGVLVVDGDFTFPGADQADMVYPDIACELGQIYVTGRIFRNKNRKDGIHTMEDVPFSGGGIQDGAMPPPGNLSFADYMRKLYGDMWWKKNIERDEKGRLCKMKMSDVQIRNLFERIVRESKSFNFFNNAELLLSKTAIGLYNNKNPRIWMLGIEAMSLYNQDSDIVEQVRRKMFGESGGRLTRADSKQLGRFLMLNHIEHETDLIVSVLRRRVSFLQFGKYGVGTGISGQAYKATCIHYAKKRMTGEPDDEKDEKVKDWLVEIGDFHRICAEFLARAAEIIRNKQNLKITETQNDGR